MKPSVSTPKQDGRAAVAATSTGCSPPIGLTYQGRPRTCGFRLSKTDVAVLLIATVTGLAAYQVSVGYSLFVPFVVYHFFLFCNVFRIARKPELIWAGVFLIHSTVWILSGTPNLFALFDLQLVFTVILVFREIRKPYYHGIYARRFNRWIDDYLTGEI